MRPVRAVYDAWVTASRRQRAHRLRGRAAAVVLAGGSGTRVGADMNKAFLPLAGRSIASWGLNTLGSVEGVGLLVSVVRPQDLEHARFVAGRETDHRLEIIHGGGTRQETERHAMRQRAVRTSPGGVATGRPHRAA